MGKIKVLDEWVVNRIAAGEVVERPASVLKELVENSIDAGATEIEIKLVDGGTRLIEVSDNGEGMTKEDAILAFRRHSTSKIQTADDLQRIATLGFRGEALPSIASVARVTLFTRPENEQMGTYILLEDGKPIEIAETGAKKGTRITVENLFYNIPARKKFLKSIRTEYKRSLDTFIRFALGYPNIRFQLTSNGKEVFLLLQTDSTIKRINDTLGNDFSENMIEVKHSTDEILVKGFITKPSFARKSRGYDYIYVNGRFVKSPLVSAAVKHGYGTYLQKGRFPPYILFISIPPELVDPNIHPSKMEVRFKREETIFHTVLKAVEKGFQKAKATPEKVAPSFSFKETTTTKRETTSHRVVAKKTPPPQEEPDFFRMEPEINFYQVHNMFILVETKNGILIIDQHAAHERVLYEQALEQLKSNKLIGQRLLFPIVIEVTPQEMEVVKEYKDVMEHLGFETRIYGSGHILIETFPPFIKDIGNGEILHEILEDIISPEIEEPDKFKRVAASIACKAAIKAGDKLSQREMQNLFDMLFATENPFSCPHGRPTVIELTLNELERRFGR
ncbi:DNA mismatch repair endonuclease MutL [bacterium]|nr:DNA mismatch repair endonuclease MutL [bacterium]